MAELDNELPLGTAPVTSGSGVDELSNFLGGQDPGAVPRAFTPAEAPPSAPAQVPQAPLQTSATPASSPGYGGLFAEGVQRNIGQFRSMPLWAQAASAALSGDFDTAQAHALSADAIEKEYPEAKWSLDKLRSLDDFGSWAAERLGENSITLLASAMAGAGGYAAGGAVANRLIAQGLIQQGSRAHWLLRAGGAGAASYPLNALMEAGGTAQEQFGVSGNFAQDEARRAILGGGIKGALESITPFALGRAFALPGQQIGRSLLGGVAKVAGLEGATEASQESVDIWLRQLADPSYSYFDRSATAFMGPGAWRLAESAAAGALVGGVFGAGVQTLERRSEARRGGDEQEFIPSSGGVPQGAPGLPLEIIADDKVIIEAKAKGLRKDVQSSWVATSDFGEVFARVNPATKTLRIESSALSDEAKKGEGHGLALYKAIFDKALAEGYEVQSDSIVSDEAARMYEGLKRRGYQVEGPSVAPVGDQYGQYYVDPSAAPVFRIKSGPVTELRSQIIGSPQGGDRLPNETLKRDPRDDELGASFLGYDRLDDSLDAEARREQFLDLMEANTKRYVKKGPDGNFDGILRNSSEVEQYDTLYRSQNEIPEWFEVDQGSLQGAGITSIITDLASPDSNRIWFVKPTPAELRVQLLAKYGDIYKSISPIQKDMLASGGTDPVTLGPLYLAYNELLSAGLRVIPSRGSSFHYTTGKMSVKPVKVSETKRSVQIAFLDFDTGGFNRFKGEDLSSSPRDRFLPPEALESDSYDGVPVAINLEGFKPGELTAYPNTFPTLVDEWSETKSITPAKKAELIDAVNIALNTADNNAIIGKIRAAMREGLYIPVTDSSNGILSLEPVNLSKLLPGIAGTETTNVARADEYLRMLHIPTWKWWVRLDQPTQAWLDLNSIAPQYQQIAKDIHKEVALIAPTIDSILDSSGLKGKRLDVLVTEDAPHLSSTAVAAAYLDHGRIVIRPSVFSTHMLTVPLSLQGAVHEVIFHEVGHFAMDTIVTRLPVGVQDKLIYAWRKALLAKQIQPAIGNSRTHPLTSVQTGFYGGEYFFSFSEWLAEQFRRWVASEWPARNHMYKMFKDAGAQLERFYKEWESSFGKMSADNMTRPDYHFTAVMDYWRNLGVEKEQLQQLLRQHQMIRMGDDVLENPQNADVLAAVNGALQSMLPMFEGSPQLQIKIADSLNPGIVTSGGAWGRYTTVKDPLTLRNQGFIELALGSMPSSDVDSIRTGLSHELWHWYEAFGIVTPDEVKIIDNEIRKNRQLHLSPGYLAGLRNRVIGFVDGQIQKGIIQKADREPEIEYIYQQIKGYEERAYYLQTFANEGIAFSNESRTVFQRIMELLQRIMNALNGLKFQSREDVLRRFFNGEMLSQGAQESQALADNEAAQRFAYNIQNGLVEDTPDFTKEVEPGVMMAMKDFGKKRMYFFIENKGIIGQVEFTDRGSKGWEVDALEAKKVDSLIPFPMRMARYISEHLGVPIGDLYKPPGQVASYEAMTLFTRAARGTKWEGVFKYYVKHPKNDFWYSPRYVRTAVNYWKVIDHVSKVDGDFRGYSPDYIKSQRALFEKLLPRVPKNAWADPRLPEMFVEKNAYGWDQLQGALVREAAEVGSSSLQKAMGENPDSNTKDQIQENVQEKARISQAQQARRLGVSFNMASPDTGMSLEIGNILDAVGRMTPAGWGGYRTSRGAKSVLSPSRHQIDEMDRIGFFSRRFLNLLQLARINEHIGGLIRYVAHNTEMYQMSQSWIKAADDIARVWERRKPEARERIAKLLFWMTEMRYLSANEVSAKVVRHPTQTELANQFTALKLDQDDIRIIGDVQKLFSRFLDQVEVIRAAHLRKTFANNPVGLQKALTELSAEFSKMRSKPYFPMMRFGKFNITVRDPKANQKVIFASTYQTVSQRDGALAEVALQYPGMRITYGTVPESMIEFLSLPGPLIKLIRERLPAETKQPWTPEQEAWFEHFEAQEGTDRSFSKRWMVTEGTQGYSMDAFRAFAHYFQSGARYISRLQYLDALVADIDAVKATIRSGQIQNSGRRQAIVDYMQGHFKYIMEGGKDYGKTKAFLALYFLGYSPAAAALNFSQIPTVMLPTLSHHFGNGDTARAFGQSVKAVSMAKGGTPKGDASFQRAHAEMVNQGRIDVGLAPELGAFAEGYNLNRLLSGTRSQRAWRGISYYGMRMFGFTEQFNRELTFKASWDLALKNYAKLSKDPKHRLYEIELRQQLEITGLMSRLQMSEKEAVSFIFAREMIDSTQFMYAPYARPPFMQKAVPNLILLFFQYTQGMLVALRYNGAAFKMLLTMAFLYGLQGLPGSDDFNELLRALARKLYGKDFDLQEQAREYTRAITRGTIFDQIGPDLVLHGISRYGFGASLLPEGYGIPRFDASAMGSMGRIIPGFTELMYGWNTGGAAKDVTADTMQRLAGAGGGMIFALMHFLMESPGSIESKKWEALVPRAARGIAKAYRYGVSPGAETTRGGAQIAKFDITDPDDLATVVGQAMGFGPTRVSETWEALRATRTTLQIYTVQKQMIYAQAYRAVKDQNQEAFNDVLQAVRDFNAGVREVDPSMAIQTRGLLSSIRNRQRAQALQETYGVTNRTQIPTAGRILDNYPGVRMQKVQ